MANLIRDQSMSKDFLGKISVLQNNFTKHSEHLARLEEETYDLRLKVNILAKEESVTRAQIDRLKISYFLQTASTYALAIQQELQTILTALLFAKRNIIHPKIVSPKQILSELTLATKHLPSYLHFPYTLLAQNTEGIIKIADIKVFRLNKLLVFVVSNPLTVDDAFDLFKLIPYPFKYLNDQFIYIKPKEEYLLINVHRTMFAMLPNIKGCKTIDPEIFLCKIEQPLFHRVKNRICEVELLTEQKLVPSNCDIRITKLGIEIWKKLHYFNTWIYVIPDSTYLKIICPNGTTEYPIQSSGTITLSSECWALTPSMQLYPEQIGFHEKYHSIIPKANISSIIAPFKSELEKFGNNEGKLKSSVNNFENLNTAGISVQLIVDEEKIYNKNMLQNIIITTIALVFILLILVIRKIKKTLCKKSTKVVRNENDPEQYRLQIEEGNYTAFETGK